MPIAAALGFLEPLLDAVDWTKLAVPTGAFAIFSLAYFVSTKLAQRSVAVKVGELESMLRIERENLAAARTTIESLKIQQASHSATIRSLHGTVQLKDNLAAAQKAESAKVFAAGRKLHQEVLTLRLVKVEAKKLEQDHLALAATNKSLEDAVIGSDESLRKVRDELQLREEHMAKSERRMLKARRLSGYIIKAKALQARPKFKLLEERRRPIISVAALKGGVGKTTITAHLAGALARKGYRVLLVDLDLQGSLTGLMLPPGKINERSKANRLMQDFFTTATANTFTELTDYIVAVPQPKGVSGTISIAPTSDKLAYAELNLMLGWLLKQGERDARFLLRRALHLHGANADYDIVLLDCPPVLNISCANALAASDYLLIPTLLTTKSLERVPVLVKAIQEADFLQQLNPHLRLLGVVANRTRTGKLAGREAIAWQRLPNRLAPIQKTQTKLFASLIA